MRKKKTNYSEVLEILEELKDSYPTTPISQHIYGALVEYGNFWGISDKEVAFALKKYKSEMELNIVSDKEVEKIVEEGKNLSNLFLDDEGEEEQDWE